MPSLLSHQTAIRAQHNFGQYKILCAYANVSKNGKSSLGQIWSKRFHWNRQPGTHNNRIDIFELRQLCRIDIYIYMTIYSCHGNHIGVPNVVFLITKLLWLWLWIVNLIVYLINVFTVRDLKGICTLYKYRTFTHTFTYTHYIHANLHFTNM